MHHSDVRKRGRREPLSFPPPPLVFSRRPEVTARLQTVRTRHKISHCPALQQEGFVPPVWESFLSPERLMGGMLPRRFWGMFPPDLCENKRRGEAGFVFGQWWGREAPARGKEHLLLE